MIDMMDLVVLWVIVEVECLYLIVFEIEVIVIDVFVVIEVVGFVEVILIVCVM